MDPPSTRRRVGSTASRPPSSLVPTPTYANVCSQKMRYLEVQLYSPATTDSTESGAISVFGEHDQLGGQVILHPGCPTSGRVSITVEGAVLLPEGVDPAENMQEESRKRKSVFLSLHHTFTVDEDPEPTSLSSIREAFGPKRRPSVPSLRIRPSFSSKPRAFPFMFTLPNGARPGEDKPLSYSTPDDVATDDIRIAYSITVTWQAADLAQDTVLLDVPFLLLSDKDFSSLDGVQEKEESWLEMPLKCDHPALYRCAVTLPTHVTFSRPSSIPFFVVFTTSPRSHDLAREIGADATISVSLLRQILITEIPTLPPTPPLTPYTHSSSSSEDSTDPSRTGTLRRLRRTMRSNRSLRSPISPMGTPPVPALPSAATQNPEDPQEKPLPRLPHQTVFSQSRILSTCFSPGFPKRPRLNHDGRKHPSIEELACLPDGLFKSKIALEKQMLQSVDWPGVSVKYYLDVSVLVGQDDFRARVPIRVL